MVRWALWTIAAAATAFAQADEAALRRMLDSQKQVQAWLQHEARRLTDKAAAEVANTESWEKVRSQRLSEMRDMLGLLPWPERTPLNVKITGILDKGSYTVEKLAFESRPKLYVTANLYVPKQRSGRLPAIVYVCGHALHPMGAKTQYQRHGISFARNGYVALIIDPIQISEVFGLHHGVQSREMYDWYSSGYTPAGVEVWNAMRAIDYLETRPEVDATRIGMTGRSGGAAMSWFTAAVDPRVKVVMPVMGISTYAANVAENTQRLHCDCMFPINHHRHDMIHQGALIAPRPLLMAHGRKDSLFPVRGYQEFEKKVKGLYQSAAKAELFGNIEVDTGHEDSNYLREQSIRWFDKHLMNVFERKLDMDYSNAPPEELAVYGGNPPADAVNFRIHETFTTRPPSGQFASAAAWETRRSRLLSELKTSVFKLPLSSAPQLSLSGSAAMVSGFEEHTLSPHEDITLRFLLRKPKDLAAKSSAILYVASDGDDPQYIASLLGGVTRRGRSVQAVIYPRGTGEIGWDQSFWKATLRNAMHVGQTIDSMRLTDVVQAFRALSQHPNVDPARITIAGKGISGAIAMYAAILEPAIHQVILIDPPVSHQQGPLFLGVLRHTDLPEAAALLAPRRLNFYGHMPPAYEYTRGIYALAGKTDRVFLAMNLDAVVDGRYDHNYASGY
jgi:cephalosporin-C deacetylase-like acetyl esterase